MRGIATHTQVYILHSVLCYLLLVSQVCINLALRTKHVDLQAMSAQTSVAVGMKGAAKAMAAMNKV